MQYKALKHVGRFKPGDIVGGISDTKLAELEQNGVIAKVPEVKKKAQTEPKQDEK